MSTWRAERNDKSRARLERRLSDVFPPFVLAHAMRQPFTPPTQRLAVESYWRHRPLLADRLCRALAARSGAPAGWSWRLGARETDLATSFRAPPAPYRQKRYALGPGYCCVCGQPVYRLGWHADLWGDVTPNKNATWHSACVVAWKFWAAPTAYLRILKLRQQRKCPSTGKRLLKTSEVDHRVPLFAVWADHRERPWPELLAFWGGPNLQVINKAAHSDKCAMEAGIRARKRSELALAGASAQCLGSFGDPVS
jgi:hypothetical protein